MHGFIALAVILLLLAPGALAESRSVPYSHFVRHVQQRQVVSARVTGQSLEAQYRDGSTAAVTMPPGDGRLPTLLVQYGVRVEYGEPQQLDLWRFMLRLLPPVLILGAILWLTRRETERGGGLLSVEQSPARLYRPGSDPVTLQDVAGMDEVKAELQEVIDFLAEPERFMELGARIPRGILLAGPPGTGKTLLARAVAGEAGVPFLSASGSDFVEMFAGTGAARVRALFAKARESAPCILFIDEIDALARQRGVSIGGGAEEREQTINQLLVEMDGFGTIEGVILMAATNRADILDPAVLRPGRFDRQIQIEPPDRQGRKQILAVHARSKPIGDDVVWDDLAGLTPGFTGADLANLMNEAALLAVREGRSEIGWSAFTSALDRIAAGGPARRITYSAQDRMRVAYHEAGHAVVGRCLRGPGSLVRVSILPHGRSLGHVLYKAGEDIHLHKRGDLEQRLAELLAGRAAEEIAFGEVSTGAADDLERATDLARQMVTRWGMDPEIGPMTLRPADGEQAEAAVHAIDRALQGLLQHAAQRARGFLEAHRAALDRLAEALLERERLEGAEADALIGGPTGEGLAAGESPTATATGAEDAPSESAPTQPAPDGPTPGQLPPERC